MNLTNKNDKKTRTSGVASLFGRGSASKIGKSQFSRSMGGIMERLKGLSRKDLAMVGVGLSVLVAAPVAEYMMSKPADSANMLTSGFSSRESASGMASLYEPGINALSQGSADGAGEVITPLSARDPSSLILGAQPEQPPVDYSAMAGNMGGETPDTSSSSNAPDMDDMRDSMRDAARNGASEAVKSAGAPTVIPPMGAGLRSLGMFADGGSSSVSGNGKSPITTPSKGKNLSPKQSQMVNPVASAGYKGVANTPKSGSKSGIEQLRAQGDAQGGYFSGAKAIEALDNANSVKISGKPGDGPGSGFGGGGFGHGEGYKDPKNGGPHNSHKHSGECRTLACIAAKKRQDKALEWEFFWKYDVPKEIAKTFINAFTKEASDWLIGKIFGKKGGPTEYVCLAARDKNVVPMCQKSNLIEVARTKDEETYKSWKTGGGDQCPCGKPPASEYGGTSEGDSDSNSFNPAEGTFDQLVDSYDDGLRRYMAKLSETSREYRSPLVSAKGVAADAYVSLDMYVNMGTQNQHASTGFGAPFQTIYTKVRDEGQKLTSELDVLLSTSLSVKNQFIRADEKGSKFLKTLEQVKENPNNYIVSKGSVTADASKNENNPITNAIQASYEEYKRVYDTIITVPKTDEDGDKLDRHVLAIKILKKYSEEASADKIGINEQVFSEYRTVAERLKKDYHDKLSKVGIDDDKHSEIRGNVKVYLTDVDSSPDTPKDNNSDTSIKEAPADFSKASAKARSWRGLPWYLEDEKKEKKMLEIYKDAAAKVKERELNNWQKDSPLEGPSKSLKTIKQLEALLGKEKSVMYENMITNNNSLEFYAPGYRVFVEIRNAYYTEKTALEYIQRELSRLEALEKSIKTSLKDNFGINLGDGQDSGQDGNPVQGQNDGNGNDGQGGNQGGDQGGNGQGGNGNGSLTRSVCANGEDNCTYDDIMSAQRWASDRNKYSKKNKAASPVWEEYKNLAPGMDKNDTEWLNHTGKVHTLRREYDALQAEEDSLKPNTTANNARLAEIDKRKREIEQEVLTERNAADKKWTKLCERVYSTNACKTSKPQNYSSVNHNNTNTTVPKPNSATTAKTSSSKKPKAPVEMTTFGFDGKCMVYIGVGNGTAQPFASMGVINKNTHLYQSTNESCGNSSVNVKAICRFDEKKNRWVIQNAWSNVTGPLATSSSKVGGKASVEGGPVFVKAKAEVSGETGSSITANNVVTTRLNKSIDKDCK